MSDDYSVYWGLVPNQANRTYWGHYERNFVMSLLKTPPISKKSSPRSIVGPALDFWLLGGASIVVWVMMVVGENLRDQVQPIDSHFLQLGALFSILSLFCNHPHFLISYRFGYGRGSAFIWRNWFSLVVLPLSLALTYVCAFVAFQNPSFVGSPIGFLNSLFTLAGLDFRFIPFVNFGTEILSYTISLMFLTVGWHYSKQAYGVMMVYARFDRYTLSGFQKRLIKMSVYSVAIFNFIYMSTQVYGTDKASLLPSFYNVPLISLGELHSIVPIAALLVLIIDCLTLFYVFYQNYKNKKILPSLTLLVPWVALHVWWIPVFRQSEYYFLAIPFFHGLQYLPFAFQMETAGVARTQFFNLRIGNRLVLLLAYGFAVFEVIPSLLDSKFDTYMENNTLFFLVAITVFINIHHFFIDSVVWKFDQKEVQTGLFGA